MGFFSKKAKKQPPPTPPPPPPPVYKLTLFIIPEKPSSNSVAQAGPEHVKFTLSEAKKDNLCKESTFFVEKLQGQTGYSPSITLEADPIAFGIVLNAFDTKQVLDTHGQVPDLLTLAKVWKLAHRFNSVQLCNATMKQIYSRLMTNGQPGGQQGDQPSVQQRGQHLEFARVAYKFNPNGVLASVARAPFIQYKAATFDEPETFTWLQKFPPLMLADLIKEFKKNNKERTLPVSNFNLKIS